MSPPLVVQAPTRTRQEQRFVRTDTILGQALRRRGVIGGSGRWVSGWFATMASLWHTLWRAVGPNHLQQPANTCNSPWAGVCTKHIGSAHFFFCCLPLPPSDPFTNSPIPPYLHHLPLSPAIHSHRHPSSPFLPSAAGDMFPTCCLRHGCRPCRSCVQPPLFPFFSLPLRHQKQLITCHKVSILLYHRSNSAGPDHKRRLHGKSRTSHLFSN